MAEWQIAETQTANPRAHQFLHLKAKCVKRSTDLPVNSLAQNHPQPSRLDRLHVFHPRSLAVEHNPTDQFRRERGIPRSIERHFIFLFDFVTGMRETLGQVAVVCQDEKARGLSVEPANVEKTRQMRRQEIEDGVARVGIAAGRNESRGLVQNDVEPAFAVDQLAVHFYVVALRRLRAEIGADLAVDPDPARGNQFIAIPARAETGRGEEAVEAHRKL